jgi:hypothetical protein
MNGVRAIAQVVSRRLPTAAAQPRSGRMGFVADEVVVG